MNAVIASSIAALLAQVDAAALRQRIQIGPSVVEVIYASPRLFERFHESFVGAAPQARADLRLVVASGDTGLRPAAVPRELDSDIQYIAGDRLYAAWMGRYTHALHALDRTTAAAVYWIDDASAIPPWERARPFLPTFQAMLRPTHWVLVHAAGIASNGRGILLTGLGHAGKSSLSLAALEAGWTFCADDFVAVECGEVPRIAPLFATARLRADMVDRFPGLLSCVREVSDDGEPRHELALNRHANGPVAGGIPFRDVVLVARRGAAHPKLAPVARSAALTALMTTTAVATPGYAADHMRKLSALLAGSCRVWSFDPGCEFPAALEALDHLLET